MIDLVASRRGDGIAIIRSIARKTTGNTGGLRLRSLRPPIKPCTPSGSGDAARRAFYLRPTDSSFEA
jgi:hypothetical protein